MGHSDFNETLQRIQRMEEHFDILSAAAQRDAQALHHSPHLCTLLAELRQYYEGGQWLRDYEMDEQGLLPAGLKRGVLSQDAVFDLLSVLVPSKDSTAPHDDPQHKGAISMEQSSAFERMMKTALEWLAGRPAEEIAANGGITFSPDRSVFSFTSLGKEIELHYPDYTFPPEIEQWHQLTILHYLNLADGTPPSGEWIPLSQMASGMIRGGGFDRMFEALVRSKLGHLSPQTVEEACVRMGMRMENSNADLCASTALAPFFPVTMKLWFADPEDDLPPSGRIFVDRTADHFLTIEDTVLLCEYLIVDRLKQELGI